MTTTTEETTMTDHTALPDVRWALHAAQGWVTELLGGVERSQFADPTPCPDFDVETLISHLYGVADRVVAMGGGAAAESVPAFAAELPDDVVAGYRTKVEAGRQAWADDASLARPVAAPWGTMPGAIVATVYVGEVLAHGWDLAVATGQPCEVDADVAEVGLQAMHRALPAEGREGYPFGPAVVSAPDAGPTERLANWVGRSR